MEVVLNPQDFDLRIHRPENNTFYQHVGYVKCLDTYCPKSKTWEIVFASNASDLATPFFRSN